MDSLFFCVTVIPLAFYFACLGLLGLRGRPTVTSGAADSWWLGLSLMGCSVVGPIQLFAPEAASARFGPLVWLMLTALYLLVVLLISLSRRPRIVIYNITDKKLREPLIAAARQLDSHTTIVGESVNLPSLELQFHQECSPSVRNAQLISTHREQSMDNWHALQRELKKTIRGTRLDRPWYAMWMLSIASGILLIAMMELVGNRQELAQALRDFLRL